MMYPIYAPHAVMGTILQQASRVSQDESDPESANNRALLEAIDEVLAEDEDD